MESWEKIKSTGRMQSPTGNRKQELWPQKYTEKQPSQKKDKGAKPKVDQNKLKNKEKALQWVEKELQKIDKEKQRLAKEKLKFQERESRLEKLKGSMLQPLKSENQDILVKTSAGEFRFGGISKNFTKKLYEWEEKKGVVPELSTFALLSSSVTKEECPSVPEDVEMPSVFRPPPQMMLSRSEGSLAEVLQPSQNSSTFSLGPEKTEIFTHLSNSEPQLSPSEDNHLNEYAAVGCYSPEEVTKLIDGDSGDISFSSRKNSHEVGHKDLGVEMYSRQLLECANSAEKSGEWVIGSGESPIDCGALWNENMSLLEKLKDKENECKTLERRLTELDSRLQETTSQHSQEVGMFQ